MTRARRPNPTPPQLPARPAFDPDQFAEATKLLKELRRLGVKPKGYDLASPYGGHLPRPKQ